MVCRRMEKTDVLGKIDRAFARNRHAADVEARYIAGLDDLI